MEEPAPEVVEKDVREVLRVVAEEGFGRLIYATGKNGEKSRW